MTIPHFAEDQNLVFVPALLALLVATVLICLPVVLAQTLRRAGRMTSVATVAWIAGVAVLVVAGWQAGVGFRALGDERQAVRSALQERYGIALDGGEVGELVDGGTLSRPFPTQASALGLDDPDGKKALKLVAGPGGTYVPQLAGKPVPAA